MPIPADDDYTCGVNVFTQEANDSEDCFTCTSTHCGDNETRNTETCKCECESGYARHNGKCEQLPVCGKTENQCTKGGRSERVDELDPPTNRWYCSGAGEEQACRDPAPPPKCGANEEYALDGSGELTCECEGGYHRHEGKCVPNPMCSDPLVANTCKVGTPGDLEDSAVDGVCRKLEQDKCAAGEFRDRSDTPAVNGVCKAEKNMCVSGRSVDKPDTSSKHVWDCLGTSAGSKNWSCLGKAGEQTWNCGSGSAPDDACSLPSRGKTKACAEPVPASHARGCWVCKEGYTRDGDDCVLPPPPPLTANAGGTYRAIYVRAPLPLPHGSDSYIAKVTASASGGKPPYTFQWAGKPTGPSAFYMYVALTAAGRTETVTVTDAADPRGKATDTAKILPPSTSNAPSGATGSAALEVPRGGELYLVWGQGGDVTARSEDTAVVTVDVSSPAIRVSGVGAGETYVVVVTAEGDEVYLPVVVR